MKMSDLQTLNDLIEQIVWMKEKNYSLIPHILNIDETLEALERTRDFLETNKVSSLIVS